MQNKQTWDAEKTVYIKSVSTDSLPSDIQAQVEGVSMLYSVHRQDGARIALVNDCALAFTLARQHDFTPVHVH